MGQRQASPVGDGTASDDFKDLPRGARATKAATSRVANRELMTCESGIGRTVESAACRRPKKVLDIAESYKWSGCKGLKRGELERCTEQWSEIRKVAPDLWCGSAAREGRHECSPAVHCRVGEVFATQSRRDD